MKEFFPKAQDEVTRLGISTPLIADAWQDKVTLTCHLRIVTQIFIYLPTQDENIRVDT